MTQSRGRHGYSLHTFLVLVASAFFALETVTAEPTCTVSVHGLMPFGVPSGYKGSAVVKITYTWTIKADRPANGATVLLYEEDKLGDDSYGSLHLRAPSNSASSSGSWSTYVAFTNISFVDIGGNDDFTDDVLEIRGRFTAHTPLSDKAFDSKSEILNIAPSIPPWITESFADPDGLYTISWGPATSVDTYELTERFNSGARVTVYAGTNTSWTTPVAQLPGSYQYQIQGVNASCRGGSRGGGTVRVGDPSSAGMIQFHTAGYSVSENTPFALLKATRVGGSNGVVSVDFKTVDNTALSNRDYLARSGTLTWEAGDIAAKRIKIFLIEDATAEPDEMFKVKLSHATGAILGSPVVAQVTILAQTSGSQEKSGDTVEPSNGSGLTNGLSWQETTVIGPGLLSFDWRLITSTPEDAVLLLDNGAVLARLDGSNDWACASIPLDDGIHVVRWVTVRHEPASPVESPEFLDRIRWTPSAIPALRQQPR